AWLRKKLLQPFAGSTIVVSHHAPSFQSLRAFGVSEDMLRPGVWAHHRGEEAARVGMYASDLSALLAENKHHIHGWCHGHLHRHIDVLDAGVRIMCNPRGYYIAPTTHENTGSRSWSRNHLISDKHLKKSQALAKTFPFRGDGD